MARGWESKAVESQQADREERVAMTAAEVSHEERERRMRRAQLELDRARVRSELAGATQPAHRTMLERALEEIDTRLKSSEG
jgi:hypothetical protein